MTRVRNGMRASDLRRIRWIKSHYSGPTGGNCVEAAFLPVGAVAVRNSRHPGGPALVFTPAQWDAFLRAVAGEAGRPARG